MLRDAVSGLLRDEGYTVESASNGATGLEIAFSFRPDIVLVDYAMPVSDGPTLVESLRTLVRPAPVLIAVSAIKEAQTWCADYGIPIFVMKPFEDTTLIRAVDSALQLARNARAPKPKTGSGTRPSVRAACVIAVGNLHGDDTLHDILPESLRHARVVVVDSPVEAERILELILPDLLILDDKAEHDALAAKAAGKGVPILVRPAAISDFRIALDDADLKLRGGGG